MMQDTDEKHQYICMYMSIKQLPDKLKYELFVRLKW